MEEKRLVARRDFLLFAALLLGGALLLFLFSLMPKGGTVLVEKNGEPILTQQLSELDAPKEQLVEGEGGLSVTVLLDRDGAQVIGADCRDQVCVKTGKISRVGESILCLPAKVAVRITGEGRAADAMTY